MASEVGINFFKALPKAELHAHLSGSISRETLHEIWSRKRSNGQCFDLEDPLTAVKAGNGGFVDIASFFPLFDKYIYNLWNDIESVKYATQTVVQDFATDGVRYLELRTTPRACEENGMGVREYVGAVNETILQWNRINRELLEVYLILSVVRRMKAEQAMHVVELAIDYQSGGT